MYTLTHKHTTYMHICTHTKTIKQTLYTLQSPVLGDETRLKDLVDVAAMEGGSCTQGAVGGLAFINASMLPLSTVPSPVLILLLPLRCPANMLLNCPIESIAAMLSKLLAELPPNSAAALCCLPVELLAELSIRGGFAQGG
jgi:hypothetical protein